MKNSTPLFIAIQNTYSHIELSLWHGPQMIALETKPSKDSSKHFVSTFGALLTQNNVGLADLSFLAVNTGPGPFSTLATLISSVNGIAFASQIPLIGVDGLETMAFEHAHQPDIPYLALLNAFNNEVYYAFVENKQIIHKGYKKIDALIAFVSSITTKQIECFGNGAILHKQLLLEAQSAQFVHRNSTVTTCSSTAVGLNGLYQWNTTTEKSKTELPIAYLKDRAW